MSTAQQLCYCCYCGSKLALRQVAGDTEPRPWCEQCKLAHYQNPKILVAAFLHCGDKLLWTKRGIEPFKGLWAFPAGYAENGESLQQAAARELQEETGLQIDHKSMVPMSISSVLAIDQVYIVFRAQCTAEMTACTTPETLDWAWLNRQDAPWQAMAHPESKCLVEQVYTAIESGQFFIRIGDMAPTGNQHTCYPLLPTDH
jgi:ADP-ribose pyrophosphatase YjhB (NUDIX family)